MGFNKEERDLGLVCGVWQGRTAGSRKITGGANQLATAAAIADKDSVEKLKKLQKKAV